MVRAREVVAVIRGTSPVRSRQWIVHAADRLDKKLAATWRDVKFFRLERDVNG